MRWDEFAEACPEIADRAAQRFRSQELCMLGTLRADGSPRISPCELDVAAGHLILGMMWQSRKALDLLRDPRCVIHTCTTDRMGTEGDAKIYARAVDVQDPDLRQAYRDVVRERIDWTPDEPNFHAFSVEVESAGFISFAEPKTVMAWDPSRGTRVLPFPDAD
ncbi:MAG TPA: pyridoxamine 5'-phosphate oxidase family protein [Actinomycetota bacterium]|nr:pyridoxamine 5'-phosphate oxidase family protein [Actinomycetota bacterium]